MSFGFFSLTFVAWGNCPQSQCICGLFFWIPLSKGLLTNSESLLGVEGREPDGLQKEEIDRCVKAGEAHMEEANVYP